MQRINRIKLFSLFLIIITSFFIAKISFARENVNDWYIKDFYSEIIVNNDSSLDITETILADCGTAILKHGIFRVLPKDYKTQAGNFILPLKLISITNEEGKSLKYTKDELADTITYKIGDPNVEVRGENTYVIKYHVDNAVRTEKEGRDELYWNLMGSYWDLEIDKFKAEIFFPEDINKDNSEVFIYGGSLNNEDYSVARHEWIESNRLRVESRRTLQKQEGVTVSVAFPKNIVAPYQYSFSEKLNKSAKSFLVPVLTPANPLKKYLPSFLIALLAIFVWYKYGRDPKTNKPVIAEFDVPSGLSPMEIGTIIKENGLHKNVLTATILNLAVNGYLKIEKLKEKGIFSVSDYRLIKNEKDESDLYIHEKFILKKLFKGKEEVRLSELKRRFSSEVYSLYYKVSKDLKERNLIDKNCARRQWLMVVVGIILIIISFGSFLFVSGILFIFIGFHMRRLTPAGAEVKRKIAGFKLYMETAEKYRSQFYEKEGMMEKLLPYAIFFGMTKEWLKKMKDIYGKEYFQTYSPAFMVGALALSDFSSFESAIHEVSNSVSSHISPSSSGMGGGGSVGGGAGGGGGGGW